MIHPVRQRKIRLMMVALALILLAAFVVSVATGYASLSPARLWSTLIGQGTAKERLILFEFRLPRIFIAILAGAGLALSGALLQSVTRNPLADPGILGINAGAGLAVVCYMLYFPADPGSLVFLLPVFAFLGGTMAAVLIYVLSWRRGEGAEPTKLVLVGVGIAAACSGAILTLASSLEREQYDFFAQWMAGKIWGDDQIFVLALLPWLLIGFPVAWAKSRVLNTLSLHEHVSAELGVPLERERILAVLIAVALASASVSVGGGIAFIGLMAPHIARSLVGPRHQILLPAAALIGAILLLVADTIGRVLLDSVGIPAGLVVSVIGAPYFMYLMARK
jgi:ABC-type Fe3+-siderophore transport system, permease component